MPTIESTSTLGTTVIIDAVTGGILGQNSNPCTVSSVTDTLGTYPDWRGDCAVWNGPFEGVLTVWTECPPGTVLDIPSRATITGVVRAAKVLERKLWHLAVDLDLHRVEDGHLLIDEVTLSKAHAAAQATSWAANRMPFLRRMAAKFPTSDSGYGRELIDLLATVRQSLRESRVLAKAAIRSL